MLPKSLLLFLFIGICIFRLIGIAEVPNGFAWDEIDDSYQAYSLLQTGKDIFGNKLPVLLHSFADYKSSLYIYATVPFVAMLGPNVLAARLPAAIFGLLTTSVLGYIVGKKWGLTWAIVTAIVMAISPWWFHYSRLSFEAVAMLALFLLALACLPRKLSLAALFFGLSIWTYSTAKFFVPAFVFTLLIVYWRQVKIRSLLVPVAILALVSLPPLWQSVFGKGGTRFAEISIFTDPTTSSEVKFALEEGEVSSGIPKEVGLQPRLIDRLAHNKPQYWLSRFVTNYLSFFSTDFLFLKGDPNPRHSPAKDSIGQLFGSDIIILALGTYFLITSRVDKQLKILLLVWILLAPIPAAITRDGAGHATRSLFLLPPLILILVMGWRSLSKYKLLLAGQLLLTTYFVFNFGYYYFSHYRWESMVPFQWGFDQVAMLAQENYSKYRQIVIDTGDTSDLMAYLAATKYNPATLQAAHPLPMTEIAPGVSGNKFGNIIILPAGHRAWSDIHLPPHTLLILSANYSPPPSIKQTILYPNSQPAFYLFESI